MSQHIDPTPKQASLDALIDSITSMNTIVYVGSIGSEVSISCSYPEGFTVNNCYVSAAFYAASNNVRVYTGNVDTIMYDSYLNVWNHTGSTNTIYLVLQKFSQ